ncbi:MAG: thioredoxin family protein [Porticoccaceae bacterium]|nr:thioredoxin family protein [Porticoccaceae bacterium]
MGLSLRVFFPLLAVLLLYGCDGPSGDMPDTQNGLERPANIDWFNGSVEGAFAAAKQQDKPIFLYWGAVWCPPCHELKGTIFKQQAFIDQSKWFIPVYLDGDTEQAQLYGEKFSVYGYPTVIVFSPQGAEITRIPGGMDIQRYMGVLELALNAITPVAKLVSKVELGQSISPEGWQLLAYYSWEQDRGKVLSEDASDQERYKLFKLLAENAPGDLAVAKSRLQMLAIDHWAGLNADDSAQRDIYRDQLGLILADSGLSSANRDNLMYGGAHLAKALADGPQLVTLLQHLSDNMKNILANTELNLLMRLRALSGWVLLEMAALDNGQGLSMDQLVWVSEQADWGLKAADQYQYHSAVNTLSDALYDAGLIEDAKTMLVNSLTITKHPYYLMSDLGYMEAQMGNNEAALGWYKKAWDSSKGPATRIQWGVNYVVNMAELTPENIDGISVTSKAILSELAEQNNGFYQRTATRIDQLDNKLESWADSPQRLMVLAAFREAMKKI